MGVKGLFSVLKSEPSRFGRRFVSDQSVNVNVFIDAPALLYHLISFYNKLTLPPLSSSSSLSFQNDIPPTFQKIVADHPFDNQDNTLSPCVIYKLTIAFCSVLADCIGDDSKIHLVVDGVASIHKLDQQLERLKQDVEELADAWKRVRNCKSPRSVGVPHLFAEEAMIGAVNDLKRCSSNGHLYHIHYAPGEAETYIANYLKRLEDNESCLNTRRKIVLSNDSDFIIFPSVVGFIPFHSLEYVKTHTNDSNNGNLDIWKVDGWEYLRSRFLRAFGLNESPTRQLQYENNLLITSSIAALAGCDYKPPGKHSISLIRARKIILNSNLGGLRQKDRNNCSSKDAVIAVSRFVGHFVSKFHAQDQRTNWLEFLSEQIVVHELKNASKASIKKKYRKKKVIKKVTSHISLEEQKQTLREVLSIIYDVYNDSTCGDTMGTTSTRELKRLIQHNLFVCRPLMMSFPVNFFHDFTNRFSSYRQRLYSVIKCLADKESFSQMPSVVEYCRANQNFEAIDLNIEAEVASCREPLKSTKDGFDIFMYICFGIQILDYVPELTNVLQNGEDNERAHMPILLFTLLLSDRDSIMLLLMYLMRHDLIKQKKVDQRMRLQIDKYSFIESISRIQIANYHLKLTSQVLNKVNEYSLSGTCNNNILRYFGNTFQVERTIIDLYTDNDILQIMYDAVNQINIEHDPNMNKNVITRPQWLEQLIGIIQQRQHRLMKSEQIDTFQESISTMWQLRLKCLTIVDAVS